MPDCDLCKHPADYKVTTGTESVAVCTADLMSFIEAGLRDLGEPFVVVRRV